MGLTTRPIVESHVLEDGDLVKVIRWIFPGDGHVVTRLTPGEWKIGRFAPSDVVLASDQVSRDHAVLQCDADGRVRILETRGINGVYVNGQKVQQAQLSAGDLLRLGDQIGLVGELPEKLIASLGTSEWTTPQGPTLVAGVELSAVLAAAVRVGRSGLLDGILVEGEPGTGRPAVAFAIHHASSRREDSEGDRATANAEATKPFVSIHCGRLGDGAEEYVFGGRRAPSDRASHYARAHGGTLFLDEIHELPLEAQDRLLDTLETREESRSRRRAGSLDPLVIAGSSQPLGTLAAQGRFRRELWEQIGRLKLAVPPLRERVADIPPIVTRTVDAASPGEKVTVDSKLIEYLCLQKWPGNVRELEGEVRAMLLMRRPGEALGRRHLRGAGGGRRPEAATPPPSSARVAPRRVRLVYVSAPQDDEWRRRLDAHLRPFEHQGLVETWHAERVGAGEDRRAEIERHLTEANVVVVLVSANLLGSDETYGTQVQRALERHRSEGLRVVPVIARQCLWKDTALGRLSPLPTDGTPLEQWDPIDDGLSAVAAGIRAVLQKPRS